VHLKVAGLNRSIDFYCGLLGFNITSKYGTQAAFISAGGYHHHIVLNTWYSKDAAPTPVYSAGLFHTAICTPPEKILPLFMRLTKSNYPFTGYADHSVSEALYLNAPDKNGVELYWDRPKEQWKYTEDGSIIMHTEALDIEALLKELE
jgi:catechol 2,3-dioxygenase